MTTQKGALVPKNYVTRVKKFKIFMRLHWYVAVVSAKTAWLSFYPQLTLWSNCEKNAKLSSFI